MAEFGALAINGKDGYHFPLAQILLRKPTDPENLWFSAGDVEDCKITFNIEKKTRYRRNVGRRTKGAERVTQLDATLTFKPFQRTPFFKALSVMGASVPLTQAATANGQTETKTVKARVGEYVYLGDLDVSAVAAAGWTAGTHFKVVSPEAGIVQMLELPAAVDEDDDVIFTWVRGAITQADKRYSAQIGSISSMPIQVLVHELTDAEDHQLLFFDYVEATVNGDVVLIGQDDFTGVEFTGGAIDRGSGLGWIKDLKS
jgi:hypothetical protein